MQTASAELIYAPPWREVTATGELSEPYGPSLATYQRKVAQFRQWAFKKPPSKESRTATADEMRALLKRTDVVIPAGERRAGELVYLQRHSVRWVAKHLRLSRRTVRVQLERLAGRLP